MSLHPQAVRAVPEQTARVARSAFPNGNPYLTMRDEFDVLYEDEQFADLYATRGQPAEAPWRLAMVTVLQFAEGLSDRQAADAVRARIDWKYALSLDLDDPGFDASVLCEFRARLRQGAAEARLLETLLTRFRERGLLRAHGRQRTDSTHVLAAVRAINRVELVTETMRHALDALAVVAPDWLRPLASLDWTKRYTRRADDARLPAREKEWREWVQAVGEDGYRLLSAIYETRAPAWLRFVPAVETLRQVWVQNYTRTVAGFEWREADSIPASRYVVSSPYDTDARLGKKRSTCWIGYKVHVTETCEDDLPNVITHVETTPGPVSDGEVTPRVHQALAEKDLLPSVHLVDTGFLDAELMVDSQRSFGVDLFGPTRPDVKWQARAGQGYDAQHFRIDWEKQEATCPQGKKSVSWTPAIDKRRNHVIKIKFSRTDCRHCPSVDQCVRSQKTFSRRTITIREKDEYEALQAARAREKTELYAQEYAHRAGVEGTLSRGVRRCRLRRSRYIGEGKVHLGHLLTAAALNFLRVAEWLAGAPKTQARRSPFARLMGSLPCSA